MNGRRTTGVKPWLFLPVMLAIAFAAWWFLTPPSDPDAPVRDLAVPKNEVQRIDCKQLADEARSPPLPPALPDNPTVQQRTQHARALADSTPRIPEAEQKALNQLCSSLLQLQNAHLNSAGPQSPEQSPDLLTLMVGALLGLIFGGLAGWLASRRGTPSPADVAETGLKTRFDLGHVKEELNRLDNEDSELSRKYSQLQQRVEQLQQQLNSIDTSASAKREMRYDSVAAPPSPPAVSVPGTRNIRSDYVADESAAMSFAKADPEPVPFAPPPPPVRAENLFPNAEAVVAAYRELIARTIIPQGDYESALTQFGELAAVDLEGGRLTIGFGPVDAEKKLVALIAPGGERAMLFPSRTYNKNFHVNFADRSQAGPEIVAAFELEVDGTGKLSYREAAIARILSGNSLEITKKGRLGGYTA